MHTPAAVQPRKMIALTMHFNGCAAAPEVDEVIVLDY
jgi:hypothetical protein